MFVCDSFGVWFQHSVRKKDDELNIFCVPVHMFPLFCLRYAYSAQCDLHSTVHSQRSSWAISSLSLARFHLSWLLISNYYWNLCCLLLKYLYLASSHASAFCRHRLTSCSWKVMMRINENFIVIIFALLSLWIWFSLLISSYDDWRQELCKYKKKLLSLKKNCCCQKFFFIVLIFPFLFYCYITLQLSHFPLPYFFFLLIRFRLISISSNYKMNIFFHTKKKVSTFTLNAITRFNEWRVVAI